ncbi:hypothetical protein GOP47_0010591 [Adiantum capillus-veneris]|uniref:Uncharacterized protein n=1 Tax=Adiantum capillus-veneris TaxID=13818 RepID=A0A9D4UVK4_ADICA|nr:hypothetical protein GOP47_0010591 [Adiantum capillus-veneris]
MANILCFSALQRTMAPTGDSLSHPKVNLKGRRTMELINSSSDVISFSAAAATTAWTPTLFYTDASLDNVGWSHKPSQMGMQSCSNGKLSSIRDEAVPSASKFVHEEDLQDSKLMAALRVTRWVHPSFQGDSHFGKLSIPCKAFGGWIYSKLKGKLRAISTNKGLAIEELQKKEFLSTRS